MYSLLLVAVGGGLGAVGRYMIANLVRNLSSSSFPKATLIVNSLGSLLLGILFGCEVGKTTLLLIGVGFCGAFTTFSTFNWETIKLWNEGNLKAGIYFIAGYIFSILSGLGGYFLGVLLL
ncbi:fluoride efflux transporter FluC [Rossellomorea aquimaris]|uniref:fluoride efflux transporter FluC n=1 Tax=Rossellomorea aquimaris TaxID=189382 RepID=UPI0007D064BC|nr:CrcB family protein [Rossellomorea aquimaris]